MAVNNILPKYKTVPYLHRLFRTRCSTDVLLSGNSSVFAIFPGPRCGDKHKSHRTKPPTSGLMDPLNQPVCFPGWEEPGLGWGSTGLRISHSAVVTSQGDPQKSLVHVENTHLSSITTGHLEGSFKDPVSLFFTGHLLLVLLPGWRETRLLPQVGHKFSMLSVFPTKSQHASQCRNACSFLRS